MQTHSNCTSNETVIIPKLIPFDALIINDLMIDSVNLEKSKTQVNSYKLYLRVLEILTPTAVSFRKQSYESTRADWLKIVFV